MDCELCRLYENREIVTRFHYEDDLCIVVDCKTCPGQQIIVLKRHTAFPTQEELRHLKKIALKLFPEKHFREPRSFREHFHIHTF